MDAHANLDFILTYRENGFGGTRQLYGGKGDAHRSGGRASFFCHRSHFFQTGTHFSLRTGHFIDQEDAPDAPAAFPVALGGGSNIIGSFDDAAGDVFHLQNFRRHLEIHRVASVISKEEENTCTAISGLGCTDYGFSTGGGEYVANCHAVAEPQAYITQEGRQVTVTTSSDDGNFALFGAISPHNRARIIWRGFEKCRVRGEITSQTFVNKIG